MGAFFSILVLIGFPVVRYTIYSLLFRLFRIDGDSRPKLIPFTLITSILITPITGSIGGALEMSVQSLGLDIPIWSYVVIGVFLLSLIVPLYLHTRGVKLVKSLPVELLVNTICLSYLVGGFVLVWEYYPIRWI